MDDDSEIEKDTEADETKDEDDKNMSEEEEEEEEEDDIVIQKNKKNAEKLIIEDPKEVERQQKVFNFHSNELRKSIERPTKQENYSHRKRKCK